MGVAKAALESTVGIWRTTRAKKIRVNAISRASRLLAARGIGDLGTM